MKPTQRDIDAATTWWLINHDGPPPQNLVSAFARHGFGNALNPLEEEARQSDRDHGEVAKAIDWTPADKVLGAYRVGHSLRPHLADGMTASVCLGDGAYSTIPNPQSYEYGGIVWHLTYATSGPYRLCAGSIIATFDYLLSDNITMKEATRRLRLLRAARAALQNGGE